jgi:hypothetical protein
MTEGKDPTWLATCVARLQDSLEGLNELARNGHSLVTRRPEGHSLSQQWQINLVVWKNGLQLHQ